MPAIAFVDGFDLALTYNSARRVDFMKYDTILLRNLQDGVNERPGGQDQRVAQEEGQGPPCSQRRPQHRKALFPELTLDRLTEPFLWEGVVKAVPVPKTEEEILVGQASCLPTQELQAGTLHHKSTTGKKQAVFPRLAALRPSGGAEVRDPESRIRCTYAGAVEPLLLRGDRAVLARWKRRRT